MEVAGEWYSIFRPHCVTAGTGTHYIVLKNGKGHAYYYGVILVLVSCPG